MIVFGCCCGIYRVGRHVLFRSQHGTGGKVRPAQRADRSRGGRVRPVALRPYRRALQAGHVYHW